MIELDRKYGIDGQYINFIPNLAIEHTLEEFDTIEQDGMMLRHVGNNNFVIFNNKNNLQFVEGYRLLKTWRLMK